MLGWVLGALGVLALAGFLASTRLHWGAALETANFAYPDELPGGCPHSVPAEVSPGEASARLPPYVIRLPSNYDPRFAHPLLIVFSPAGLSGSLTERFTGLTAMATARGVVVAYVDHVSLGLKQARLAAKLPARIAADWCIDPARITLAGHSDGGTLAQVIGLADEPATPAPTTLVASAAGLLASDFPSLSCPPRMHVLLLHGEADDHFPDYGRSAAQGWARCLQCQGGPERDAEGCLIYRHCNGSLHLCLHSGNHLTWPDGAGKRIVNLSTNPPDQD